MPRDLPSILFIDAYDSFSNNIISLLETTLSCAVRTVKIDDAVLLASDDALVEELSHYDAVVCGPGPGSPENEKDVGIFRKIWRLSDEQLIPVLGICLGFQSLCLEFGGKIQRLKGPQHGIVRDVIHIGEDQCAEWTPFEGVGKLRATHYQSLCIDIGQETIPKESWVRTRWKSSRQSSQLQPLAYAESDISIPNISGIKDERVLVAVKHISKPFFALQYHPESICTEVGSHKVIAKWFEGAKTWNSEHRRCSVVDDEPSRGKLVVKPSLLSQGITIDAQANVSNGVGQEMTCFWKSIEFPLGISITDLAQEFCPVTNRIVLESTNTNELLEGTADVRGRFSILALDAVTHIRYHVGSERITKHEEFGKHEEFHLAGASPWVYIADYMQKCHATDGPEESPFWGGLMGYTTYELGLESINVTSSKPKVASRPDLCLAWVTKSLVVDHRRNQVYVQLLGSKDHEDFARAQITELVQKLEAFVLSKAPSFPLFTYDSETESLGVPSPSFTPSLSTSSSSTDLQVSQLPVSSHPAKSKLISAVKPIDTEYEAKVQDCQSYISAGDSYELCLTDQTTITRPTSSAWDLYLTLRSRQPAPFASYISLGGATLVSSSPERFLTWNESNHCSLRPMKGTVRKSPQVNTMEKARTLLDVPKERAENLMIVDLVRHDLHGICGSGNVQVPRLCVVEEYKSVYQMISVVEGQIVPSPSENTSVEHTGLDVLAASLPPGSMTGAPKKRSCEILQGIEQQERSLYSGVAGYIDVRGRGDWSVTIRSMFKWDDEDEVVGGQKTERWHIGAGGAVTTLSTAVGEREEMSTKLAGTLGIFMS